MGITNNLEKKKKEWKVSFEKQNKKGKGKIKLKYTLNWYSVIRKAIKFWNISFCFFFFLYFEDNQEDFFLLSLSLLFLLFIPFFFSSHKYCSIIFNEKKETDENWSSLRHVKTRLWNCIKKTRKTKKKKQGLWNNTQEKKSFFFFCLVLFCWPTW